MFLCKSCSTWKCSVEKLTGFEEHMFQAEKLIIHFKYYLEMFLNVGNRCQQNKNCLNLENIFVSDNYKDKECFLESCEIIIYFCVLSYYILLDWKTSAFFYSVVIINVLQADYSHITFVNAIIFFRERIYK